MENFEEEAEIEQLIDGIEGVIDGQSPSAIMVAMIDVLGQMAAFFNCTKDEYLDKVRKHLSLSYDDHMTVPQGEQLQ